MPTIIDSLIVKLGLNSSEFTAGKSKVDKGLKETGKNADSAGASVAKFLAVIGGTAAIERFVASAIESSAALDRLSQNLGLNVSAVSAWSNAVEVAGGSASGLQGTMDMLSKSQTELQLTGQTGILPYLSALGVGLTDARGKAMPVNDMLVQLADRFSGMDRTTANNMGRMMGLDQGTMQLLLKGRSEVELMIKRQTEFGAVTKKQAEESSRMRAAMIESRQSFEAFGRELLSSATPAIEKFFGIMADFGAWVRDNKEFVGDFLKIIGVGLIAIAAATIPINLTVVAVLALAAAVAALWQDYQVFKRGGDSLIDWAKWEPGIKGATKGLLELKEIIADLLYVALAGGDALIKLATGDFSGAKTAAKAFWEGRDRNADKTSAPAPTPTPSGGTDRARFVATAAARLKVPESVIDAHLKSETGATGKSAIGDFNYGNIKAGSSWSGASKSRNVLEYDDAGRPRTESAAFRSYSTPEDAGANYAELLAKRYPGTSGATDVASYAKALKAGGYATDPNYVAKMVRGTPGASRAAAGAGASQVAQSSLLGAPGASNRSVETHIGEVKVYTRATDAPGIARDMGKSLDYLFTSQANYGLN